MPRSSLPRKAFSREHVLAARDNWIANPGWKGFKQSKSYDVIIEGVPYPPKPIIFFANLAVGNPPIKGFNGALKGWGHQTLKNAGYKVVPKRVAISDGTVVDPGQELEEDLDRIVNTTKSATERMQMIKARIGQGTFREGLLSHWDGKCAVLGIARPEILRASHIRRWRDCEGGNEGLRLDPENGLLLSANLDCLFENGLIAFDDDGRLLRHAHLQEEVAKAVGIHKAARLSKKPTPLQALQLKHHRSRFGF